jgi:hypothetical protein
MTVRLADILGPFLGNGSVNTLPFLRSKFLILKKLDNNDGRAVFSMWSVPRCYKSGARLELISVWESVKRGLKPGGIGIAIVRAVARKRLVRN